MGSRRRPQHRTFRILKRLACKRSPCLRTSFQNLNRVQIQERRVIPSKMRQDLDAIKWWPRVNLRGTGFARLTAATGPVGSKMAETSFAEHFPSELRCKSSIEVEPWRSAKTPLRVHSDTIRPPDQVATALPGRRQQKSALDGRDPNSSILVAAPLISQKVLAI